LGAGDTGKKKWMGSSCKCDFCGKDPKKFFVDGRTTFGPWALMCEKCYPSHGTGQLGLGYGQKYDAKTREKIGG
jgi:hypothetical protein